MVDIGTVYTRVKNVDASTIDRWPLLVGMTPLHGDAVGVLLTSITKRKTRNIV